MSKLVILVKIVEWFGSLVRMLESKKVFFPMSNVQCLMSNLVKIVE